MHCYKQILAANIEIADNNCILYPHSTPGRIRPLLLQDLLSVIGSAIRLYHAVFWFSRVCGCNYSHYYFKALKEVEGISLAYKLYWRARIT
jgi:hypothetical protein